MVELSTDVVRGRYCDGTFYQTGATTDGEEFDAWAAAVWDAGFRAARANASWVDNPHRTKT